MAVNKARIRLWVKALRSGKYKQTTSVLRDEDGAYCCLGVACEVYADTRHLRQTKRWNSDRSSFLGEFGGGTLPPKVAKWYGFEDDNPYITNMVDATNANDDKEWSFKRIATAVEKMYLKPAKRAAKRTTGR